jgi:photosystem II stability/assembly factor-like uncharacterized protein
MSDQQRVDELPLPEQEVRTLIARVAARGASQANGMTPEQLRHDVEYDRIDEVSLNKRTISPNGVGPGRSKLRQRTGVGRGSYAVAAVVVVLSVVAAVILVDSHQTSVKGSRGGSSPRWRLASMVGPATELFTPTPGNAQSPFDITCPTATVCYVTTQSSVAVPGVVNGDDPSQAAQASVTTGAYVSTDAGSTWRALSLPSGVNLDTKFTCPSATTCMVGSQAMGPDTVEGSREPQLLLATTDGGATWSEETVPLPPITGSDSAFDPSLVGVVGSLSQLTCFSASTCLAFGLVPSDQQEEPFGNGSSVERSVFLRTDDGGATWTTYDFPWVTTPNGSPAWSNAQPGVFACATSESCVGFSTVLSATPNQVFSGLAWRTNNGGATWSQAWLPSGVQPSLTPESISCSDVLDCVSVQRLAGMSGPYTSVVEVSTNGGNTWAEEPVPNGAGAELLSVSCVLGDECWLAGTSSSGAQGSVYKGVILESTDSGTSWNTVELPENIGSVNDVSCPSTESCFAIAGPSPALPTAELSQEVLTNAPNPASS